MSESTGKCHNLPSSVSTNISENSSDSKRSALGSQSLSIINHTAVSSEPTELTIEVSESSEEELSREGEVERKRVDTFVRAHRGPNQGGVLVSRTFDPGQLDPDALLVSGKAQLVFSTKAMTGCGSARSVELMKKENDEEIADGQRQKQLDNKFMQIKHLLGLGQRDGFKKKSISYSINWHFIEIFDAHGNVESRVDLLDKAAIKKLLKERGLDHGDKNVEVVYNNLLRINREVKKITKKELGDISKAGFIHDCTGNPNGPPLFQPESQAALHVLGNDKKSRKCMYNRMMRRFGLINRMSGGVFGKKRDRLTANGERAVLEMRKVSKFQICLIKRLNRKKKAIQRDLKAILDLHAEGFENKAVLELKAAEQDITKVLGEIERANRTAIDMTLMELHGTHSFKDKPLNEQGTAKYQHPNAPLRDRKKTGIELLGMEYNNKASRRKAGIEGSDVEGAKERKIKDQVRIAKSGEKHFLESVSKENKSAWKEKPHTTNEKDSQAAKEVGLLVANYQNPDNRLKMIEISQELGRTVYQEPRAEKFLLANVRNPNKNQVNLQSYSHLKSQRVKDALQAVYAELKEFDPKRVYKNEQARNYDDATDAVEVLRHIEWEINEVQNVAKPSPKTKD